MRLAWLLTLAVTQLVLHLAYHVVFEVHWCSGLAYCFRMLGRMLHRPCSQGRQRWCLSLAASPSVPVAVRMMEHQLLLQGGLSSIHSLDRLILHRIFCMEVGMAAAPSASRAAGGRAAAGQRQSSGRAAGRQAAVICPMRLVCREWRDVVNTPRFIAAALTSLDGPDQALVRASTHGREDVAVLILESGENAPPADCLEGLALIKAAGGGHEAVVRLLLEHKAAAARADCQGGAALVAAAQGGHEAVARLLLKCKEHAARADCLDGRALYEAAAAGHEAVVRLLLGVKEHAARADCVGGAALFKAAAGGHTATVQLLLDHPEHAARADCLHSWALVVAAQEGHEAVARLLLEWKEHAARADCWGGHALVEAARGGHEAVVRLLLECNEHAPNARCREDALAAGLKHAAVRRLLLTHLERVDGLYLRFRPPMIRGCLALAAGLLAGGALAGSLMEGASLAVGVLGAILLGVGSRDRSLLLRGISGGCLLLIGLQSDDGNKETSSWWQLVLLSFVTTSIAAIKPATGGFWSVAYWRLSAWVMAYWALALLSFECFVATSTVLSFAWQVLVVIGTLSYFILLE